MPLRFRDLALKVFYAPLSFILEERRESQRRKALGLCVQCGGEEEVIDNYKCYHCLF